MTEQQFSVPPVQVSVQVLPQGPDGTPWVQVVTQYGLMASTLIIQPRTARELAGIYMQQLTKGADEARRLSSGLIVPAPNVDLTQLRRDLNGGPAR